MIKLACPFLAVEDVEAAIGVLKSGWLKQGKTVRSVENQLADIVGTESALVVSSCTGALYMALREVDVCDGEVIVPSLGFGAPVAAIIAAGGIPVFADCASEAPLMFRGSVTHLVTERTKAILAIHLYGLPCDALGLADIAAKYRVPLIEDTAYGIGTKLGIRSAGSLGRFGCMSFGASKVITGGEGGVIFCSAGDRSKLEPCREYGMSRLPGGSHFTHVGLNFRITEFQAALVLSQLNRREQIFQRLTQFRQLYEQSFSNAGLSGIIRSPWGSANDSCLLVALPNSGAAARLIRKGLTELGVETETAFLMHQMSAYQQYVRSTDSFVEAEKWANRILRLPLHSALSEQDVGTVTSALKNQLEYAKSN